MAIDLTGALRRKKWMVNKRSLAALNRLTETVLSEVQSLHAKAEYENALLRLAAEPEWQNDPRAWRLAGLCYLGLKKFEEALDAFDYARGLNRVELAKEEINMATTYITMKDYNSALQAANRAKDLAPNLLGVHVCLLSILNRCDDRIGIEKALNNIRKSCPDLLLDKDFLERVENDTDLNGVAQIMKENGAI